MCVHFWEGKVNRLHRSVGGRRRFWNFGWQHFFGIAMQEGGKGGKVSRCWFFSTETTSNESSCLLLPFFFLPSAQSGGYKGNQP